MQEENRNIDLEQAEINNKIKDIEERMSFIASSSVYEELKNSAKSLVIQQGEKTKYDFQRNTYIYTRDEIQQKTARELISDVLTYSGYWNFSETKWVMQKLPTEKDKIVPFYQLMNQFEEIRVQDKMMYFSPWTYDYFGYRYEKKDSRISSKQEQELPKHLQFLYGVMKMFWWDNMQNLDAEVKDILEELQDDVYTLQTQDSTVDLVNQLTDSRVWEEYLKLYKEQKEEEKNSGKQNPYSQMMEISPRFDKIMEQMEKEGQKQINQGNNQDSNKESFGKDIDQKYEAKERWEQWGEQDGEDGDEQGASRRYGDPFSLEPHDYKWHDEPSLAQKDYLSYEVMYEEIKPYMPFFVSKLKSIMKDNMYKREWGAYRTWKLNTSKLFKFPSGSDRLFKRKILRRHKDYKVTLLVDQSGSMTSSEKNRHAAKGTILLAEVLNKVWIPFEIRGFNEKDYLYKRFSEPFTWKNRRQLERIILESHWYNAWGNNDGWAVNLASHYIRKASTKRTERILIVLSDGQPAPSTSQIPREEKHRFPNNSSFYEFDLHTEIAKAEKDITCIGIGINASHVSQYYKQNVIVNDVSQLPQQLLLRLKSNIRRW